MELPGQHPRRPERWLPTAGLRTDPRTAPALPPSAGAVSLGWNDGLGWNQNAVCIFVRFPGTESPAKSLEMGFNVTGTNVVGKKYLAEQAATLLKFAKATTDPDVAAGLLSKAADLSSKSDEALDTSPQAPDVEQPEG